jgi:hypothetical protein
MILSITEIFKFIFSLLVLVVRLVVQVNINLVAVPDPPIQFVLLVQVVVQVNKKV